MRNRRLLHWPILLFPQAALAQGGTVQDAASQADWSAVLYALIVLLIFVLALFLWFQQRQRRKSQGRHDAPRD